MSLFSYSQVLEISDEYNLVKKNKIEFKTEEELNSELEKLSFELVSSGFVTSSIEYDGEKINIIPGKIDKVILMDNAVKNSELKKNITGLSRLEGKILNISNLDKIVYEYDKISSNNVSVDVIKSEKDNHVNVLVDNKYTPIMNATAMLNFVHNSGSNSWQYNLSGNYSQPLGFNDEFNISGYYLKEDKQFSLNYSFPIMYTRLNLMYNFNGETKDKIELSDSKHEVSLDISRNVYKDKINEINLKYLTRFSVNRQSIRGLEIKNLNFFENEFSLKYDNYSYIFNNIHRNYIDAKMSLNYVNDRYDNKKDYIANVDINLGTNSMYYDGNISIFYTKNLKFTKNEYDRYKKSINISSFSDATLNILKSDYVVSMSNKFKYPYNIGKFTLNPYIELAGGLGSENYDLGMALGLDFRYNKIIVSLKNAINIKKKYSIGLKLGVSI